MKSSRAWEVVVYPDSESYVAAEVLAAVTVYFTQWCYILHDKDFNDDGTPKKAHYHVYGKFDTPRSPQTVANALGVVLPLFVLYLLGGPLSAILSISTILISISIPLTVYFLIFC